MQTSLKDDLARYGELKKTDKNIEARMAGLDVLIQVEPKEEYGKEYYQLLRDSGNIKAAGIEIYNSFTQAMQLITVMQEALKFYANEEFQEDVIDVGSSSVACIYVPEKAIKPAVNALSQAAKMGVE